MKPFSSTIVITPAVSEPITVDQLMKQLRLDMPVDGTAAAALTLEMLGFIGSARATFEDEAHRALVLQTRELQLTNFPVGDGVAYAHSHGPIRLPSPPLLSVLSVSYTDQAGATQTMPADATLGTGIDLPAYAYQRSKGTETQPGRISPARTRWWPATLCGEGAVRIRFRCGYGGSVTVSATATSAVLASSFTFVPDDVGLAISIPGAGAMVDGVASPLVTTIAAVDGSGVATLATSAETTAAAATAYLGAPVPVRIVQAILLIAQGYYMQDADVLSNDLIDRTIKAYRL